MQVELVNVAPLAVLIGLTLTLLLLSLTLTLTIVPVLILVPVAIVVVRSSRFKQGRTSDILASSTVGRSVLTEPNTSSMVMPSMEHDNDEQLVVIQ
jgi:membrane protein implicated in regulation of membrane protease activity